MDDIKNLTLEIEQLRSENRDAIRQCENLKRRIVRLERDKQYSAITTENIERLRDFNAEEKERQHLYNQLLLANCPDMIFVFDRKLMFLLGTKSSSEFLRYSSYNDLADKPMEQIFGRRFPADLLQRLATCCHDVMGDGQRQVYSERLEEEDPVYLTITVSPANNHEGACMGAVVVIHDVTNLTLLKVAAEKSSSAKSLFLATMSHEMRTPMNAIIGMSTIAKNTQDISKIQYCMEKIENASIHLLGVINDVLDISKIESGKFELSPGIFDFEKMISRVVSVQTFRIEEKEQTFTVNLDSNLPHAIICDEQRLAQVITNLLANAIKFTPEKGKVSLNARALWQDEREAVIEISISDTGIGMTTEQQANLFHRFQQADSGISRKFGGTGLGLVISKNIVQMMGGAITVSSTPDEGSCFSFTVHVSVSEDAAGDASCGKNSKRWNEIKVLAVDDTADVLEYFQQMGDCLGVSCTTASSGAEALQILKESGPKAFDIIFVDWIMPEMDGIALTKELNHLYPDGPVVIMMSASEWPRIAPEAEAIGINRFLQKPLFSTMLSECITACLGISAKEQAEPAKARSLAGKRILLVEDVALNREIVISLLEDTEAEIISAENGEIAVELFCENPTGYDLIFMDIHMPLVDGYEATRRIRALPLENAASIPIVAMTANVFREDVDLCLACGMNDHIAKPIDITEVRAKMLKYLMN